MGTVLFPVGKSGRDVALTTHPHLSPKLRIELYLCSPYAPSTPVLHWPYHYYLYHARQP